MRSSSTLLRKSSAWKVRSRRVDRSLGALSDTLDSLAQESGDDLQLQSELAAAYEKVGELQGAPRNANLSDYAGAIASYEKARDIRRRLLQKTPNDLKNLREFAANLSAASAIRWWSSDTSGSLEDSQQALETYERLLEAEPESMELRLGAAEAQIRQASTYYYNDKFAQVYPWVNNSSPSHSKAFEKSMRKTRRLYA